MGGGGMSECYVLKEFTQIFENFQGSLIKFILLNNDLIEGFLIMWTVKSMFHLFGGKFKSTKRKNLAINVK